MSVFTVKLLVALILIGHGLGHAMTALPVFGHTLSRSLVPNKVGVIAVDAFAILSILLLRWPPAVFGG